MRSEIKEQIYCLRPEQYIRGNVICLPAADIAGSRLSKVTILSLLNLDIILHILKILYLQVFAILHMLSKDLAFKVSLADDTYNLYKNIKLPPQDEVSALQY